MIQNKTRALAFGLAFLGLTSAGAASAACGDVASPSTQHSSNHLRPAVYRPDDFDSGSLMPALQLWPQQAPAVTGLWEFEVHLKGAQNGLPNGFLLDWGLATWHIDGTEIQFSAGRPPDSGDVCMGAWREVGPNKFDLHHIALGLTPADASGMFVGPTIITATITVDPYGNSYSGSYDLNVYAGSPDNGTEFTESGAPLVTFTAQVTAKRVVAR